MCKISVIQLFASPAYPYPIRVTQPDGTTLEVRLHGDEFLHWMTCNQRLVQRAADGFFYYADFDAAGNIVRSSHRVTASAVVRSDARTVMPPAAAIQRAMERRAVQRTASMQKAMPDQQNFYTEGSYAFLTILVNFKDVKFVTQDANTKFYNLLNQQDYAENGATGSSRDYYYDNSNGLFSPTFEVYGPVDLPNNMAYYGANDFYGNDAYPREMVYDAVAAAIATEGLDLTRFDHNGDQILDNVFIFYAGYGEASGGPEDSIWPHKWNGYGTFQGITIDTYACGSELRGAEGTVMDGIGTFTHEFGHVLGLPDFYDIDYDSYGYASGLGVYSLMDTGCYNNDSNSPPYLTSMERLLLGWSDGPVELTQSGHYQLAPVYENHAFWTPTENEGEYFMYEYRDQQGWDMFLPEKGIVIYHVDQSGNRLSDGQTASSKWQWGDINNLADHQCFDIEEAAMDYYYLYGDHIPFPGYSGNTRFDATSNPAAEDWAGNPTGYYLSNLSSDGSFDLTISQGLSVSGVVQQTSHEPVSGAQVSAVSLADQTVVSTTTDEMGAFSLETVKGAGLLEVVADGFLRQVVWLDGSSATHQERFTLTAPMNLPRCSMQKFSGPAAGVLTVSEGTYVGVSFTQEDLQGQVGQEIRGVEFSLDPRLSSLEGLSVFVYDRTEQTMLTEVEIEVPESCQSAVWVDFKQAGILIEAAHDYVIGYRASGVETSDLALVDAGPQVEGGTWMSEDGATWKPMNGGNLLLALRIAVPEQPAVHPMIYVDRDVYQAGDYFCFRLRKCAVEPQSVIWTLDGKVYEEDQWIELPAGEHEVRAVLIFEDGSQQSIVQELRVE